MMVREVSFDSSLMLWASVFFMMGETPAVGSSIRRSLPPLIFRRRSSRSLSWPPERTPARDFLCPRRLVDSRSSLIILSVLSFCFLENCHHHLYFWLVSRASIRFSSKVISLKTPAFWKPRLSPFWALAEGESFVMSSSFKMIEPAVIGVNPEMALRQVVLPEPFCPISPTISPDFASKLTP